MAFDGEQFIDRVWECVHKQFVKDVLTDDSKMIPVPSISSASFFDLYSIFIKSRSETIGKKFTSLVAPNYNLVGHVSHIINLKKTDLDRLLNSFKPLDEETNQMKKWECDVEINNRSVHLTLEGIRKTIIPVIMEEGDLHLNHNIPDIACAKSVYIITDVLKVDFITASVTSDNDTWERISLGTRPIAFGYAKFRLGPDGLVAEQLKTNPCSTGKWNIKVADLTGFFNTFSD